MFCKVCKDAGKTETEYTSHYVKDKSGKVICPHKPVEFSIILFHSNVLEEQKEKINNIKDLLKEKPNMTDKILKENNIKIKVLPFKTTFSDD